ncbi:RNA-binding S4 domain-containing protein [Halothiobacillus sp.]|uniref:RNA-binding S4 domain-containing protein n=1 Tax=Halothiobacillus sp. TaxID=1891311 RepID=UPI002AD41A4E|nr:RNA-binding S4 domain-containing protein [Halothiobacillus sp.]
MSQTDSSSRGEQRVDTWLWAARFFKTRSLAVTALSQGKIRINGQDCRKPAKVLRVGDQLDIERDEAHWVIEVRGLARQRGPASVAQTLYSETAESQQARQIAAAQRQQTRELNPTLHKPDPHTRALLRALRGKPA